MLPEAVAEPLRDRAHCGSPRRKAPPGPLGELRPVDQWVCPDPAEGLDRQACGNSGGFVIRDGDGSDQRLFRHPRRPMTPETAGDFSAGGGCRPEVTPRRSSAADCPGQGLALHVNIRFRRSVMLITEPRIGMSRGGDGVSENCCAPLLGPVVRFFSHFEPWNMNGFLDIRPHGCGIRPFRVKKQRESLFGQLSES